MNLLGLDHLALSCETLDEGAAYVSEALGVDLPNRGEHPDMGTHNRLLSLGPELYFEVIAINPDAPAPDRPRWFNIDAFTGLPRLTNWIAATTDMTKALRVLPGGMGAPISLRRGDYRWDMAVPETGLLPFGGWAPAIIQWHGTAHPAPNLPDQGVRLKSVTLCHPDAIAMAEAFAPHLPRDTILFQPCDTAHMEAVFDTPHGEKTLR